MADGRHGHPELRLHRVRLGAAARELRPLPPRDRHRRADGHPGPGVRRRHVVYVGWNYADGYDPAWIVVIAHSQALQTWYAHMSPTHPGGIRTGSRSRDGQIIGYEGNTGHSTGAHLHWAVEFNGDFVNPRLFL